MSNNKEGKPDMVDDVLDGGLKDAYELGIDHCIQIAEEYLRMKSLLPNDSSEYNFTNLISRFKSLKK